MKQRWLPEFDYPDADVPRADTQRDVAADTVEADGTVPPAVLPGQRALFTAERELTGQIEAALAAGRFEDARRCLDALVALEGPSPVTRAASAVDGVMEPRFWERPLNVILGDLRTMDRALRELPVIGRLVGDGVLSRLLEDHEAVDVVRAAPEMLAPIVNRMCATAGAGDDLPDEAAALVRDALLGGFRPEPSAFDHGPLADLLAEAEGPAWLACLGALRRLWPVPAAGAPSGPGARAIPPDEDEARGVEFWECLRVAVSGGRDDPAAAEARRRMKQIHPGRHAWFMRSGVRREP